MKRTLVLSAFVCMLGSAVPSSGTLAELDLRTSGDGLLTRDSGTGLEWLDLTETVNYSYNSFQVQLGPGGLFEGFRRATPAEVDQFYTDAGMSTRGWDSSLGAGVSLLLSLCGITESFSTPNGGRTGARAFTSQPWDLGHNVTSHFVSDLQGDPASAYAAPPLDGSGVDWFVFSGIGQWVVRDSITVPDGGATILMLGVALGGLGMLRRINAHSARNGGLASTT